MHQSRLQIIYMSVHASCLTDWLDPTLFAFQKQNPNHNTLIFGKQYITANCIDILIIAPLYLPPVATTSLKYPPRQSQHPSTFLWRVGIFQQAHESHPPVWDLFVITSDWQNHLGESISADATENHSFWEMSSSLHWSNTSLWYLDTNLGTCLWSEQRETMGTHSLANLEPYAVSFDFQWFIDDTLTSFFRFYLISGSTKICTTSAWWV